MTERQRQLAVEHMPFAKARIGHIRAAYPHAHYADSDEMESTANLALLIAAMKYDPQRGSFKSIARKVIDGKLLNIVRNQNRRNRRRVGEWHLRELLWSVDDESRSISQATANRIREIAATKLSKRQKRAVHEVFFCGGCRTELAESMGISADGVHALIRRARWKMRDMDDMRLAWDEYRGVA